MASLNDVATALLEILVRIEKLLDVRFSESWSHRRLPTLITTLPIYACHNAKKAGHFRLDSFLQPMDDGNQELSNQISVWWKSCNRLRLNNPRGMLLMTNRLQSCKQDLL